MKKRMIDLQQLQIISQLVDNMEISSEHMKKAYAEGNPQIFNNSKSEILDAQNKIADILK